MLLQRYQSDHGLGSRWPSPLRHLLPAGGPAAIWFLRAFSVNLLIVTYVHRRSAEHSLSSIARDPIFDGARRKNPAPRSFPSESLPLCHMGWRTFVLMIAPGRANGDLDVFHCTVHLKEYCRTLRRENAALLPKTTLCDVIPPTNQPVTP